MNLPISMILWKLLIEFSLKSSDHEISMKFSEFFWLEFHWKFVTMKFQWNSMNFFEWNFTENLWPWNFNEISQDLKISVKLYWNFIDISLKFTKVSEIWQNFTILPNFTKISLKSHWNFGSIFTGEPAYLHDHCDFTTNYFPICLLSIIGILFINLSFLHWNWCINLNHMMQDKLCHFTTLNDIDQWFFPHKQWTILGREELDIF